MKCIKVDLPDTLENIEIELFYDLHIGSTKCEYKIIQERIKRVEENENVYAIIGGDVINNSTKNSVGDVYSEPLTPMQQIRHAMELFRPIKDKIICVTSGNHENRTYKQDGIDLLYLLCAELGIQDRYDYTACLAYVRLGKIVSYKKGVTSGRKVCYSIYVQHGSGGGSTIGGKANALKKRGNIIVCDVLIVGHTHEPITFKTKIYQDDPQNSKNHEREQLFVNSSSTLGYEAYAEQYGLAPTSLSSPVIILNGTKKQANCII